MIAISGKIANEGTWSGFRPSGLYGMRSLGSRNSEPVLFDNILFNCPQSYKYSDFISISDMSEDEIIRHPECETIGGYIKTIIVEADKQKWWDEDVSDDDKEFIKSLPYFDAEIFYECVGIRIK